MVTLAELVTILAAQYVGPPTALTTVIANVTADSRQCRGNDLFVAIKGFQTDGHQFINAAIAAGALAVVSEEPPPTNFASYYNNAIDADNAVAAIDTIDTIDTIAWLQVANARIALAKSAAAIYRNPSKKLQLVGITGTNGKTTTAFLVDSIFRATGKPAAILSTIYTRIGTQTAQLAVRTTPEANDTQRLLADAVANNCATAVMEVSSIAIDLHRVEALEFATVVFTNFTQDHLDYHHTMEAYFAAKQKLFDGSLATANATAVLNNDDPATPQLQQVFVGPQITYGTTPQAMVHVVDYQLNLKGLNLQIVTPSGRLTLRSTLIGKPHIYNILAAVAVGIAHQLPLATIKQGIESMSGVPGRFERVAGATDFAVVVDYAHTDDALSKVLQTAREVAIGRVICLFGCGGDRDRRKRPLMAAAAARYSDLVVITSDNPRSEDPVAIIEEAAVGLQGQGKPYQKIVDRRAAIEWAINQALPGDIVIIAGKGHENYQILRDRTIPFDDLAVAAAILTSRQQQGSL
jgi:UDP-N-acetylmuramoyl-L-alanyl-D-glutamate--2,6-diaminopimelate ligase